MKADGFVAGVFLVVGMIVVIGLIMMLPTYFLWNWLMPQIFNLPKITLFQALGMNFLFGILFKGSGGKD